MSSSDVALVALQESVEQAAGEHFPGARLVSFEVLPGGHSGLTHIATLRGDGIDRRVVIKSTPAGRRPVGRHDVLRQARVLEALGGERRVPIPEVLFTSEAPVPLFAMQLVDGFAAEPVMEDPRPDERAEDLAAAWVAAIEVLARLQEASPASLGLGAEPLVTPLDEVERWSATMRAGGLDADPGALELARSLALTAPEAIEPCVVHGDFRLGNMLQYDGTIAALVDWEIWSIGDPRFDLGWLCLFTQASNFPGFGRQAAGTPSPESVVARYQASVGGDRACDITWFRALACFKLAAVQAHNLRRHREGRYRDPHQERLVPSTTALITHGLELLSRRARLRPD